MKSLVPLRSLPSLMLVAMLAGTCGVTAGADQRYSGMVVSSRYLTMRDGTKIAIDLFLPKGLETGARLPAILEQNRYWRSIHVPWPFRLLFGEIPNAAEKRRFVTHGYAWIEADVRGTGASYGSCPNPNWSMEQIRDGADIVDWIIRQPWSNGKVGATGISFGGTMAQLLLANDHPAVRAVAVRYSEFDEYADVVFPGGIFFSSLVDQWGRFTQTLDRGEIPDSVPTWMWLGGKILGVGVRPVDADRDGSMLGAAVRDHRANFDQYAEVGTLTYRDDVGSSGLCLDRISAHRYASQMQASGAAVYSQSGWLDGAYVHAAIKRFLTLHTPGSRLVLGPWSHGGLRNISPSSASHTPQFDFTGELLRFFDYHLEGMDTGIAAEKPVHYFTMGEERWRTADTWPPPDAETTSYYFAAANRLATEPSSSPEAHDTYRVDTGAGSGHHTRWDDITGGGTPRTEYTDRREADAHILVYTSAPLERDTEVTGHPLVTLYVRSSAVDGQFFVYLEDVDEEGRVFAITGGQLRAIHRKLSDGTPPYRDVVPYHSFKRADAAPLVPGEIAELVFDLMPTSYLFRRGHSIRVALAGADADHFAPLPGDPPILEMYRDTAHPSHIDLPIIPRSPAGQSHKVRSFSRASLSSLSSLRSPIRYRVETEPLVLTVCHCTECQRQSGSAFGMSLAVAKDSFRLLSGELKTFTTVCDSGRTKACAFCPSCGTRIHHQVVEAVTSIKPGTLDDTSWLVPTSHYWTKRKQPWVPIPSGASCFEDDG